ncbi:hypothetical protein AG1IA_10168 [Rhizoctonia solani AG-1 IA]|uniref:Uncharacterized protein n=1 Tax=Thanatephorus cucumeris (strain AG1-IA) TaxID=983506 RepID=L8WGH5_THACA|nr:hypothetical protein AG1IA_10168 [Rhizoctonia solani AG-1 IA]
MLNIVKGLAIGLFVGSCCLSALISIHTLHPENQHIICFPQYKWDQERIDI